MRAEPHPISGMMYEELGDGLVRVSRNGSYGVFRYDGTHIEGDVTHADPHFLNYVGGPNLPEGADVFWAVQAVDEPPQLFDRDAAGRAYTGDVTGKQAELANAATLDMQQRVVARYVGDRGKVTEKGPRSAGWFSKEELFARETYPELVPEIYRVDAPMPGGMRRLSVDRYIKREYHDLEVEKIWKRVWQMACHQDDLPEVGDYLVYDVAHLSFLIVRASETEIKAYYNACLHRGRQLREFNGKRATEFRCPFHGWSWKLDGSMKEMTCPWDFPDLNPEQLSLPEARVGLWGGMVFINPDPGCMPLEEFLGESMIKQFEKFELEKRWKQVHVARVIDANWKLTYEAFNEGWHVVATHPQVLLAGADSANNHYDVFGNFARGNGNPVQGTSAHRGIIQTPEEAATERRESAAAMRDYLRTVIGDNVDIYSDTEMLDQYFNALFPNLHPWGGWARIVFRFRPYGDNPERSIMEVIYLAPWPEGKPKPPAAQIHWVENSWCDAPELGSLARIIDQDMYNLPKVQRGLKTKPDGHVYLSNYGDSFIRNFHQIYDRMLAD